MSDTINVNTLVINDEEKKLDTYRSFFYTINAKPDSITKTYSKRIKVDLNCIHDLNRKILAKIRMHCTDEDGFIPRITINYSNHESEDYSSWSKFEEMSTTRKEYIESITIKWMFNVKMPQYELPQLHTLVVKITSGLKFEEFMSLVISGKIEDVNDANIKNNTVVARVDFVNTLLGEEVINVVSNWVDSCNHNNEECNKLLLLIRKYRQATASIVELITNIVLFGMAFSVLGVYFNKIKETSLLETINNNHSNIVFSIGILYICLYIIKKISRKLAQKTYKGLEFYGEGFIFCITAGDTQRNNDNKMNNKKIGKQLCFKLISAFLFDLICTIIISYILK